MAHTGDLAFSEVQSKQGRVQPKQPFGLFFLWWLVFAEEYSRAAWRLSATLLNEPICRQEVKAKARPRSQSPFLYTKPTLSDHSFSFSTLQSFHHQHQRLDRMDFVFRAVAIRDKPHPPIPPPHSSKLQPQRWRGCWVINIFDASDTSSDVLLWSMLSFPSYFSISSVCHPWDWSVLLHLRRMQVDTLTSVEEEIDGERRHQLLIVCSVLMSEHSCTISTYVACCLWVRYLPVKDILWKKNSRHMTELFKWQ